MTGVRKVQTSGETELFYIVGSPVRHFCTPDLFTAQFRAKGREANAAPLHGLPEDPEAALVDRCTPAAERTGSVNFIRSGADGTQAEHDIDCEGFLLRLTASGFVPVGAKVVQVGAGGVGRAVAFSLAEAGIAELTIINRDPGKAQALAAEVQAATGVMCYTGSDESKLDLAPCDLLVNATSSGKGGAGGSPLTLAGMRAGAMVADVVISVTDTPFIAEARAFGCRVVQDGAVLRPRIELCETFPCSQSENARTVWDRPSMLCI